jgi:hypothetical protein
MTFARIEGVQLSPEQVGVAISHSPLGGGHIGLCFHSGKNGLQLLHLAWHRNLRVEAIPADIRICWVADIIDIPTSAAKQLVALMRFVSSRKPHIGYGINLFKAKGSFDARGIYSAPVGSDGLTCATFVVEVLRSASINLVDESTWAFSQANVNWGVSVCRALADSGVAASHVDSVKSNISGFRMRPFEVAGVAQEANASWPVNFQHAQTCATRAEQELLAYCPSSQCA